MTRAPEAARFLHAPADDDTLEPAHPASRMVPADAPRGGEPRRRSERGRRMILYVGPEVWMPLASALGSIAGALLLFWRQTVAAVKRGYRFLTGERNPGKRHV